MALPSEEEETREIYIAIGEAITAWTAHIEGNLSDIFGCCLGPSSRTMAGGYGHSGNFTPILYAIPNFQQKLGLISAAMNYIREIDDEIEETASLWDKEAVKLNKLSQNRNRLAHWNVIIFQNEKLGRRLRLTPPFFSPDYHKSIMPNAVAGKPSDNITAKDIMGWRQAFVLAGERLKPICPALAGHEGLQSRFLGQAATSVWNNVGSGRMSLESLTLGLPYDLVPRPL